MGKAVSDKTFGSSILITAFEILFPRAIDSNSIHDGVCHLHLLVYLLKQLKL